MLRPVTGGSVRDDEEREGDFLREAASVVAGLAPEDRLEGCLVLPLRLSAAVAGCGVDLHTACSLLVGLRTVLITVAGIDGAHEPTPLVVGDRRQAILTLASYLDGLFGRCCSHLGVDADDLLDRILVDLAA
ncbi:MAG TPA: hypothetical protein VGS21_06150 [Acidimicrobiales bacterium]|nr:hypothetical protein [Acidimicrobiales bacterium]